MKYLFKTYEKVLQSKDTGIDNEIKGQQMVSTETRMQIMAHLQHNLEIFIAPHGPVHSPGHSLKTRQLIKLSAPGKC